MLIFRITTCLTFLFLLSISFTAPAAAQLNTDTCFLLAKAHSISENIDANTPFSNELIADRGIDAQGRLLCHKTERSVCENIGVPPIVGGSPWRYTENLPTIFFRRNVVSAPANYNREDAHQFNFYWVNRGGSSNPFFRAVNQLPPDEIQLTWCQHGQPCIVMVNEFDFDNEIRTRNCYGNAVDASRTCYEGNYARRSTDRSQVVSTEYYTYWNIRYYECDAGDPSQCAVLVNPLPLDLSIYWPGEISPRGIESGRARCFDDPFQACDANRVNQPSGPFPVRPQQGELAVEYREVTASKADRLRVLDGHNAITRTRRVTLVQCVYFYTCYYKESESTLTNTGIYLRQESSCKYWDSTLDLETALGCPETHVPVKVDTRPNSHREVHGDYHIYLHGIAYRCHLEGSDIIRSDGSTFTIISPDVDSFRSLSSAAINGLSVQEVKSRPVATLAQLGLTSTLLGVNLFGSAASLESLAPSEALPVTGFSFDGSPADCSLPGNAGLPQCTSAQYRRGLAAPFGSSPGYPVPGAPLASGFSGSVLSASASYLTCYREPGFQAGPQHIVIHGNCPAGYRAAASQSQPSVQPQSNWRAAGPKPSSYVLSPVAASGNLDGVSAFSRGYSIAVPTGKRKKMTLFAVGFGGSSSAEGFSRDGLISPSLSGTSFGGAAGFAYQFNDKLKASFGGVYLGGSSESEVKAVGRSNFALSSSQSGVGALAQLNYRNKQFDIDTRFAAVYFNSDITREDSGEKSKLGSLISIGRVQAGFNLGRETFVIKPFLGGEFAFASVGEGLVNTGERLLEAKARSGFSLNGDAGVSLSTIWKVNESLSISPELTGSISVPLVELTLESEAQDVLGGGQTLSLVQSAQSEQLTYVISPGVSAQVDDSIHFNLGYSGRFADQSTTHSGTAQVGFTF